MGNDDLADHKDWITHDEKKIRFLYLTSLHKIERDVN